MQLVLEIRDPAQRDWAATPSRRFVERGGVLGRHPACDWVMADPQRHVSNHHAVIGYQDGRFVLIDTSRNGIHDALTGERLPLGIAHPIRQDSCYRFGHLSIHARLENPDQSQDIPVGQPARAGSVIPDDAFLPLDPLQVLQEKRDGLLENLLGASQPHKPASPAALDGAGIDRENLTVPRLVEAVATVPESPPIPEAMPQAGIANDPGEAFWQAFAAALGVPLDNLQGCEREQLALAVAALLRQGLEGLQHSLRIRRELNSELRLDLNDAAGAGLSPLTHELDSAAWLDLLRHQGTGRQPSAAQAILSQALLTLQAHQVGLLKASHTVLRQALEQVSPGRLTEQMTRPDRSWLTTDGQRWRAYVKHHQALSRNDDWVDGLLARDFARAYTEQVRLVTSLYAPSQG